MSTNDSIFLGLEESPGQIADWLMGAVGVERYPGVADEVDRVGLRGRLVAGDDWFSMVVQRNRHVSQEPEEVQAIDRYGIDISIRARDEDALHRQSRLMFDKLIEARPDIAILLLHNLEFLVAAHLPGVGTHDFAPETTPDAEDLQHWGPWTL